MTALRILTFNWHEAYLCLLAKTGHDFSVVDKIKGGCAGWLAGTRPVPADMRVLPVGSEETALAGARSGEFDLVVCHNLADLALVHGVRIPKILVFHNRLSAEIELFRLAGRPAPTLEQYVAQFLSLFDERTQAIFVSETKRADAVGIEGEVILPGIDLSEYGGYRGDVARVLRVGNFFTSRDAMLGQTMALAILGALPSTVLGINPEIPGSRLSSSWEELKEHYRSNRVYLNTTMDAFEDGYNLAMLEAMATGMPVVSVANRTSPIEDGLNGYVGSDPLVLHEKLDHLLHDAAGACAMGARARETVARLFPLDHFVRAWDDLFHKVSRETPVAVRKLLTISAGSSGSTGSPTTVTGERRGSADGSAGPNDGTCASGGEEIRTLARTLLSTPRNPSLPGEPGKTASTNHLAKLARARILVSSRKYDEARSFLRSWAANEIFAPLAWLALGSVELSCGNWAAAEKHFRASLKLDPDNSKALCGLGLAMSFSGRDGAATDALAASLNDDPSLLGALPVLIRCANAAGRHADARRIIRACLALEPENTHLLFSCAVLSACIGEKDEALRLLDRIETIEPSFPELTRWRAIWNSGERDLPPAQSQAG